MFKKIKNIFSAEHAQVPVVDVNHRENIWRIYYSSRVDGMSQPKWVDLDSSTFDIVDRSPSPILELGKPGAFDQAGIMPTCIIEKGDYKLLYYIGWTNRKDVPYHNSIGLARSDDGGNTWYKFFAGPIFNTSKDEPGFIGTMCVIPSDSLYKAWYLSCRDWEEVNGIMESKYTLNYATSLNGIDWSPRGVAIDLEEGEGGLWQASVIKENGIYKMWFSVRGSRDFRDGESNSYKIHYAESANGIIWERKGIAIDRSEHGWDSEMVAYPCIVDKGTHRYAFYNGNKFGKTGIGYAKAKIK